MYTDDERKYLEEIYGTGTIGNCRQCKYKGADTRNGVYLGRSALACGQTSCPMITTLKIKRKQEDSDDKSVGNKIKKLHMLGYTEQVVGNWLILIDNNGRSTWINSLSGKSVPRIYDKIIVLTDMIICIPKYDIEQYDGYDIVRDVEVYSIKTGTRNLAEEFKDNICQLTYSMKTRNTDEYVKHVVIYSNEPNTNRMVTVVIHKSGNRLITMYDKYIQISSSRDSASNVITLQSMNKTILTDDKMNIKHIGTGLFAFNM